MTYKWVIAENASGSTWVMQSMEVKIQKLLKATTLWSYNSLPCEFKDFHDNLYFYEALTDCPRNLTLLPIVFYLLLHKIDWSVYW